MLSLLRGAPGRIIALSNEDNEIVEWHEYAENTHNISKQTFDHRANDPCNAFSYDNLDRLTDVEYIDDTEEAFTIDDLGNRDSVDLRDGGTDDYDIDELTNRYESVAGNTLGYDAAGNVVKDKDGYEYEYDYENRIVKITKNDSDIAAFAYDGLGRRIRKRDYAADASTIYYCNYEWQVLEVYDGSGSLEKSFVYGNYIDEVLARRSPGGPSPWVFYAHNHLYSPVALLPDNASIWERYEYDAYGNVHVMDGAYNPRSGSSFDNTIYFTGRRMDILDDGELEIYYYRHRYYDDYTGRFMMHDPLGINPAGGKYNTFNITSQYQDGLNLYEYVNSNPLFNLDKNGLETTHRCKWWESLLCGWELRSKEVREYRCYLCGPPMLVSCKAPYLCYRIDDDQVWECKYGEKVCKTKHKGTEDWTSEGIKWIESYTCPLPWQLVISPEDWERGGNWGRDPIPIA